MQSMIEGRRLEVKEMRTLTSTLAVGAVLAVCGWLLWPATAAAHCDKLDGPVVLEAKAALDAGDVTPVLKWVKEEHESDVRDAFQHTLTVRALSPEARELADRYFFETLVRLHREGEGAPYTGLKPGGQVEAPVAAADKAIADGNVNELAAHIGQAAERSVREHFEHLLQAKAQKDNSVEAGREYVETYVVFVHFVEGLHNSIAGGGDHH
jgi:hypothetical protein